MIPAFRSSRRGPSRRAFLAAAFALPLAAILPARAQTTAATDAPKDETVKLDSLIVTGSAIPTPEGETYSPVTLYSPAQIARSGAALPIEVLRTMPGFSGAVNTEQRTNGGSGSASVNLRGLAGTLTLLDGRRTAGFDNFNVIPTIGISRIEIVKDGASATYGADALSGVFNTVLVPRYTGQKVDFYYGNTTDKDAGVTRVGLMVGGAAGRLDGVFAFERYARNAMTSADRAVSANSDGRLRGGRNGGSPTFSGRTTARVGSATAPVQDLVLAPGKTVGLTAADFIPFDTNPITSNQLLNFRAYTPSIPKQDRYNLYSRVNYKVSDSVEAYARLIYGHDKFYNGLAPAPMPATGAAGTALRNATRLSPQAPTGLFLGGGTDNAASPAGGIIVGTTPFRTLSLGPRTQTYIRDVFDFGAGLSGHFARDWNWNADYVYGVLYRDDIQAGAPGRTKLVAHILDGSYNPFALDSAKGVGPTGVAFDNAKALQDSSASGKTDNEAPTRGADFNLNGSVFALPAGDVKIGIGGDYYRNDQSLIPEPIFFTGDLLGLNGSNPSISRSYGTGVYTELQIPLINASMNVPFVRALSLSAAGRYDYQTVEGYQGGASGASVSRSFTTQNPKFGLRWQVNDELLLRGTWSTGFRLPTLTQLFAAPGTSSPQLTDPLGFPILNQTQISTSGNPLLEPEKSKTYSTGIVFSPKAVGGLSVVVDYYFGEIKGLVGEGSQFILNANAAGQGAGFQRGNAATINPAAPFAGLITRAASGSVTTVASTNFNISGRKTTGVDYGVTYAWPNREHGRFITRADWSTMLTWELTPVPGAAPQSFVGVYIDTSNNAISPGSLPKQKGYLSQIWEKGPWAVVLTGNYIGKLRDDPNFTTNGLPRTIEAWVTVDTQVEYKFRKETAGWKRFLSDTSLRVGSSNVLNESAPFAAGAFNDFYDVKTHSSRGRFVYMELLKKF